MGVLSVLVVVVLEYLLEYSLENSMEGFSLVELMDVDSYDAARR